MKKWNLLIFTIFLLPIVNAQGLGHCAFGNYPLGNCEVIEAPTGDGGDGSGGAGGFIPGFPATFDESTNETLQRYDVIVKVEKNIYEFNETVIATITIVNKGDIPDEDTVLIYFLSNPINKKIGETREQFLEIPVGKTELIREVLIPPDELSGEWRFTVKYFTSFQSTIEVFDPFIVKEERTLADNIKESVKESPMVFIIVVIVTGIVIFGVYKKEYQEKKSEREDFRKP